LASLIPSSPESIGLFATLRERYGLIGFRDEIYYFKKSMDGYVAISEPSKNFDSEAVKVKEHE